MIGLGSNRLSVCRRGGMRVTQAGKGGMEWLAGGRLPRWSSPYSAAATAALLAQFPTQWQTIRYYGFAHPEIVPWVNEKPIRWGNILGVYTTNFNNFISLYTWCEYIKNTSTSRIDTGVIYDVGESPRVDVKWLGESYHNDGYGNVVLGYYGATPSEMMFSVQFNETQLTYQYRTNSNQIRVETDFELNKIYEGRFNTQEGSFVNGELKDPTCMLVETRTLDFPIFTRRPNTAAIYLEVFLGRIYECDFLRNGNYIRIYMPCYRKNDGVIGMFDIVNNRFYANSGGGTFGKGSDIPAS